MNTSVHDWFCDFEFLLPYLHTPSTTHVPLTSLQWELCLAKWPKRYTGGDIRYYRKQSWLERVLRVAPQPFYLEPDKAYLRSVTLEMQMRESIMLDGVWHKVVIQ